MEMDFEIKNYPCLRWDIWDVQTQEQTLEIKLPDGMPDIGSILGAWGQWVLRGKEWRADEIGITGGIMVWVLYLPAEGGEPRSVEGWIPVAQKWPLSNGQREGIIRSSCCIKSTDARMLTARKLLVRGTAEMLAEVMEPVQTQIPSAKQVPKDVQLLKREYPVQYPAEAGEKAFRLEDTLLLPEGSPVPERILYCRVMPQVTERKVSGNRAVFRGNALCHLLYKGENGAILSADSELPFSQLEDLAREYDRDDELSVEMELTGLETEIQEGKVQIKMGLAAQYLVLANTLLEIVEDAYSTRRDLIIEKCPLQLHTVLDSGKRLASPEVSHGCARLLDIAVNVGHPVVRRNSETAYVELPGTVQLLGYDDNGDWIASTFRWSDSWEWSCAPNVSVHSRVTGTASPQQLSGAQPKLKMELEVQTDAVSLGGMEMICAMEPGEIRVPDPQRPSLVIKRQGNRSLWELAKANGSTVGAICDANRITDESAADRLLLIPVL